MRVFIRRIFGMLPALLVFCLLAAVGFWGHRTGWMLPKFNQLMGKNVEEKEEWCDKHNVPEAICIECKEELLPRGKAFGWCKLHGISECPHCHPELVQAKNVDQSLISQAVLKTVLNQQLENSSRCQINKRRIQFASSEAVEKAGLAFDIVSLRAMTESISMPGQIGYDPTKVVHLSPRTAGTIWQIYKVIGDTVQNGEVLALVDSAEVGKAKTEYANAVVQEQLRAKNFNSVKASGLASSERETREAEASVVEARLRIITSEQTLTNLGLPIPDIREGEDARQIVEKLRFLGVPKTLADEISKKQNVTNNLLPVKASQSGVVIANDMVAGEGIDPSKTFMVTADTRQMWLTLNLRAEDVKLVSVGQKVKFMPDSGSIGEAEEMIGNVAWLSTMIDDKTRTLKVRVDVPNINGKIKANSFGNGQIILREEAKAVTVPNEAVQWEGCCHVVFVRHKDFLQENGPKVFYVRQVRVGISDESHTEILAGLFPGEVIVGKGSAALRGELLKDSLGDG